MVIINSSDYHSDDYHHPDKNQLAINQTIAIFEQTLILMGIFITVFVLILSTLHYWKKYQYIQQKYHELTLYKLVFA